jgi:hypothetical protein
MRDNPFSIGRRGRGQMTNPSDMQSTIPGPFTFATRQPAPAPTPGTAVVALSTITALKELLGGIASTFREHGMFDLASQADDVAALL